MDSFGEEGEMDEEGFVCDEYGFIGAAADDEDDDGGFEIAGGFARRFAESIG